MATPKTKKTEKKTYTYAEYVKHLRPKSLGRLYDVNHEPQTQRPAILARDRVANNSEQTRRRQ